jgi:hypothetical protein
MHPSDISTADFSAYRTVPTPGRRYRVTPELPLPPRTI